MKPEAESGSPSPIPLPDLVRLRFGMRAVDPIQLPDYPGSTWRGLLGHGLRRTVCVTRQPTCKGCLLIQGCVYAQVFETPPPPDRDLGRFTAMPHPYWLDIDPGSPRHHAPGDAIELGLTLVGPAIAHVPYLIHALGLAGEHGIGQGQGRFALQWVERETEPGAGRWERVYDAASGGYTQHRAKPLFAPEAPDRVRLHLVTPLRIKRDGHFVVPRAFRLADLMRHLHVRLHRLSLLYGGDPDRFEWGRAGPLVRDLTLLEQDLQWHDWTRYSSRQNTQMQMGGLLGDLVISGPTLAQVWPALWAGQWTHVGKATSFGLGCYRLRAVDGGSNTHERDRPQACDTADPGRDRAP